MESDIHLYLKYFHKGGKDLGNMLSEVDNENKSIEEGTATAEHIDNLRTKICIITPRFGRKRRRFVLLHLKSGGAEKTIQIGFTSKVPYKTATRKKSKNRYFEWIANIHQDRYSNTGNAWKVWDSGLIMSR